MPDKLSEEFKKYTLIHLDEKWTTKHYISSYTDINPSYNGFIDFVKFIANKNNNILITTGMIDFDLLQSLKSKFFI